MLIRVAARHQIAPQTEEVADFITPYFETWLGSGDLRRSHVTGYTRLSYLGSDDKAI